MRVRVPPFVSRACFCIWCVRLCVLVCLTHIPGDRDGGTASAACAGPGDPRDAEGGQHEEDEGRDGQQREAAVVAVVARGSDPHGGRRLTPGTGDGGEGGLSICHSRLGGYGHIVELE
jgi:hypothetical protein